MRRVVITGMGTVNPLANSVEETWDAVKQGKCGIGPITHFDTTDLKVKLAGEVKNFDAAEVLGPKEARRMDVYTQYACAAAKEALADSGLDMEKENADRCGCIVSSGIGGLETICIEHSKGEEKGYSKISPYFIPMTISNMAAGQIAIMYGLKGMCTSVVTACASSNNAIGDSFHRIRDGYEDVMVCGGAEGVVIPLAIGGFQSMKALCTGEDPNRASIPFDKERHGFVMGEGAGILVIEELEHAKARGAKIYAEIVGYGTNCDAYHITAPNPEGEGGAKCMALAVKDAGLEMTDVDYINAHGTSTSLNDAGETLAIKKAFGDHAYKLMVSSTKSMTGHLLGAAGAVEGIITTLALRDGFVPATINYREKDEDCDLDIVPNEGRKADINVALSNALGFGGHNASIVFKKYI
ncbi:MULTISPECIES: beta-ketoacyl-ACP synthase II [Pseudobutyrivibrio]|jgi:3-oxoacyl-[acyl-carrier-protein] synthase II|uniref:3-oxoacyl-[acyl-carrier-protein] synthase 2 n=2 Tax=Pseudobutyrivibrio TaxID=46205 RepID=A0A2G3DTA6_9FIRM|nr:MULTISPECIES: beta-ketoacyl-ACP synthase II [Pseudobutyrivibrio]MBE5904891.1 beta-ketoacyl-[acyl-carrier-protein] synthase II [Pseudobutyrivibrio sp.]PHU34105.1 beta-ketoacyl-[acyl-carrier-protein] synthase II [Pseudobutyrivibrio ruminis]SCY15400.1 3-oxoacyl-[acyl-carrier-protein] synthase II [Pseudobutyrivibrio sp. AR14]